MLTLIEKIQSLPEWAIHWLNQGIYSIACPLGEDNDIFLYEYHPEPPNCVRFYSNDLEYEQYISLSSRSIIDVALTMAEHWSNCEYNPLNLYETTQYGITEIGTKQRLTNTVIISNEETYLSAYVANDSLVIIAGECKINGDMIPIRINNLEHIKSLQNLLKHAAKVADSSPKES